jgi:hypothetical protein
MAIAKGWAKMSTPKEQAKQVVSKSLAVITAELDELEDWTIDDDEDSELAADMLRDVKARHKALEAKRKEITKPLNAATKAVNDLFRAPRSMLEQAEQLLKSKIAGYLEAQDQANAAALETAAIADTPAEASAALASIGQTEAPAGVSVRSHYRAIVFNPEIVPYQFLMPDEAKIQDFTNAAVRERGKPEPIPGVRFEKIAIVSSRAKVAK